MRRLPACLAIVIFLIMCGNAYPEPYSVFVSIPPQKYFVEKIGGNLVSVSVLVPPGADAHSYEPKPSQMAELAKTKMYFTVGFPFEDAWLPRIQDMNKNLVIVHTDQRVKKLPMSNHHHEDEIGGHHKYEENHDMDHQGLDPHIWLSPSLVMLQAREILNGLLTMDPDNRDQYGANYHRFICSLAELDLEIKNIMGTGDEKKHFMVFHPAWGYFADAYGLAEIPIEMEGKEPKPAKLKELIEQARKENVKAIFVQPQFSTKSAETVAKAIGADVLAADDLAENWPENLKNVARQFKEALK
jgi:zinc transport system substrate-binding protein